MPERVNKRLAALSPQRRLVLGALVASLSMAAITLADPKGLRRMERLRSDIERQEQKNRELREENLKLGRMVRALSPPANTAALEKAAREQLGFVRQDELLFKFE